MHALHATAAAGHGADKLGARHGHAAAASSSSGDEPHRAQGADAKPEAASAEQALPPDASTQVTFSPSGLKVLEDAALNVAGTAKEWVHDIGDAAVDIVSTAADAIDEVGEGTAKLIAAGADVLVKGVGAARSGVNAVATATSDVLADTTERVGAAVESTVGYAALAALAAGALLNEFV